MKIAYLTTSFVPSAAANSVQVMKMAQALGRLGHDVTLYAAFGESAADPFDLYGVERCFALERAERTLGGKLGAASYMARQTAKLWRGAKADLYYGRAARLLIAAAPFGRPLIYEAHVLPDNGPRRTVQHGLFAIRSFARLVCISDALRRDYLEAFPELDPAKVIVAHDGSDPIDLSEPIDAASWPAREGAFQVGYVGGIYPGRGVETLVEAAERLEHIDFHVVGGNEAAVAAWRERRPSANVHFHGHVPHAALRHLYPRLDALVAPYKDRVSVHGGGGNIRRWMSPLKVFEYMSTGRPIVCSDVPVLREVLRDGDNALLLPGEDLDAWTHTLDALAADPARCRALGDAALADFDRHYTWQRRAAAVISLGDDA